MAECRRVSGSDHVSVEDAAGGGDIWPIISEDEPGEGSVPYLVAGHLQQCCDGACSAVQLQVHMANAVKDGFHNAMIDTMAAIGAGQHAQEGAVGYH